MTGYHCIHKSLYSNTSQCIFEAPNKLRLCPESRLPNLTKFCNDNGAPIDFQCCSLIFTESRKIPDMVSVYITTRPVCVACARRRPTGASGFLRTQIPHGCSYHHFPYGEVWQRRTSRYTSGESAF